AAAQPAASNDDPLAILNHGKRDIGAANNMQQVVPDGMHAIVAAITGTVVSIDVGVGDAVRRGQPVAVLEAMKMEHVVTSSVSGVVQDVRVTADETLTEGSVLFVVEITDHQDHTGAATGWVN